MHRNNQLKRDKFTKKSHLKTDDFFCVYSVIMVQHIFINSSRTKNYKTQDNCRSLLKIRPLRLCERQNFNKVLL